MTSYKASRKEELWLCESITDIENAIDASIKHWEKNCEGPPFNISASSCALCEIYRVTYEALFDDEECAGCPVSIYSGANLCERTPYIDVYYARASEALSAEAAGIKVRDCCEKELEFLKEVKIWFNEVKHLWGDPKQTNSISAHLSKSGYPQISDEEQLENLRVTGTLVSDDKEQANKRTGND